MQCIVWGSGNKGRSRGKDVEVQGLTPETTVLLHPLRLSEWFGAVFGGDGFDFLDESGLLGFV